MQFSRRQFLQGTSASLVAAAMPSAVVYADVKDNVRRGIDTAPRIDDPDLKAMMACALDAARDAGAVYADVRYQYRHEQQLSWFLNSVPVPNDTFTIGVGVRALYNGYWGYAAFSGMVTADGMARLGREAVGQARTGARGKARTVELAPRPVVDNGKWTTPIKIDPFAVSWEEKHDVMKGLLDYIRVQPFEVWAKPPGIIFRKIEQTFAASDGSSYTQTLYTTRAQFFCVGVSFDWRTGRVGQRAANDIMSEASAGWEYVLDFPIEAQVERLIRQATDARQARPVDIGRYDIVFDSEALAQLINAHIGRATELDRAMTYRANTEGTSYLNDPLTMLGHYQVGSPLLTVTANRSLPRGVATVQWDDEGVVPDEAILVRDGILTDFQTTRESASWLAPYYHQTGAPLRSHGGARSDLFRGSRQGPHNLVMAASKQNSSFADLCSGVTKGLAVLGGEARADHQGLTTESAPELVYEITNGKLGRVVDHAVISVRAPEFWRNLVAIGGRETVQEIGTLQNTVSAPAALVKNVAVTNNMVRSL